MLCKNPYQWQPAKHLKAFGAEKLKKLTSIPMPCGVCLHCRINYSIKWTNRILLECLNHDFNSFVTITYEDDYLPNNASLCPEDVTKFIKRLRRNYSEKIRYFMCGEYGEKNDRPHYHFALFNISPGERSILEKAWSIKGNSMGFVDIGELNKDSARYITGYIIKGAHKSNDYTEEKYLHGRHPEFRRMSTHPALGSETIRKFARKIKGKTESFSFLHNGKTKIYLDKTLKRHMADELGYQKNDEELIKYCQEIYESYCVNVPFQKNYKDLNGQKMKNREIKHKIFKSRRNL